MDLTEKIDSIGTNDNMRRAQKMTIIRSRVGTKPRHTPPIVAKGESSVHCLICQQPRHYATQFPLRKGKSPIVNTILADIQQVTTRQQAKNADWAA